MSARPEEKRVVVSAAARPGSISIKSSAVGPAVVFADDDDDDDWGPSRARSAGFAQR